MRSRRYRKAHALKRVLGCMLRAVRAPAPIHVVSANHSDVYAAVRIAVNIHVVSVVRVRRSNIVIALVHAEYF